MIFINPKRTGSVEMAINMNKAKEILPVLVWIYPVLPKSLPVLMRILPVFPRVLPVSLKVFPVKMRIFLEKMRIFPVLMRITVLLFGFFSDFSGRNWNRSSNNLISLNLWA